MLVSQVIDSLKVTDSKENNDKILDILQLKSHLPTGFEKLVNLKALEDIFNELEKKNKFLSEELKTD